MIALQVIHLASRREPYRRGGLILSRQVQAFPVEQDGEELISAAQLLALLEDPLVLIKHPDADGVLRDVPEEQRDLATRVLREKIASAALASAGFGLEAGLSGPAQDSGAANEIPGEKGEAAASVVTSSPAADAAAGGVSADGDGGAAQVASPEEPAKVDPDPASPATGPAARARGRKAK